MSFLDVVKNGINDVDVIYCADKQTFGANIKVHFHVGGCVESKSDSVHAKCKTSN